MSTLDTVRLVVFRGVFRAFDQHDDATKDQFRTDPQRGNRGGISTDWTVENDACPENEIQGFHQKPLATPRWIVWSLVMVTLIAQAFAGFIYVFGIISQVLVENGFTPSQIDFLYACGTLGQFFGVIPGLLHDSYGPIWTGFYGISSTLTGYTAVCLLLSTQLCPLTPHSAPSLFGMIEYRLAHFQVFHHRTGEQCGSPLQPPESLVIWELGFALFVLTQGASAIFYAVFPTLLIQFPLQLRGLISGVVVGAYGLSGILLTAIFERWFSSPTADGQKEQPMLLAFLSTVGFVIFSLSVILLTLLFYLRLYRSTPAQEKLPSSPRPSRPASPYRRRDRKSIELSPALGVPFPRRTSKVTVEISGNDDGDAVSDSSPTTSRTREEGLIRSPSTATASDRNGSDSDTRGEGVGPPPQLLKLLTCRRYLLYAGALAIMQSCCAVLIGNISMIRESHLETDELGRLLDSSAARLPSVTKLVKVLSIGNFLGRLTSGLVSRCILPSKYHSFFLVSALLIAAAEITMWQLNPSPGFVLSGALFAAAWAMGTNFVIGPVWVMQSFSAAHFASLQAISMGGVALATCALSMFTGKTYEYNAHRQMKDLHRKAAVQGPVVDQVGAIQLRGSHVLPTAAVWIPLAAADRLRCFGTECFMELHLFSFVLNFLAAGLVVYMSTS